MRLNLFRQLSKNDMNITEFARLGGHARWKGTTKKQRSEIMREIAKKPRKKPQEKKPAN